MSFPTPATLFSPVAVMLGVSGAGWSWQQEGSSVWGLEQAMGLGEDTSVGLETGSICRQRRAGDDDPQAW